MRDWKTNKIKTVGLDTKKRQPKLPFVLFSRLYYFYTIFLNFPYHLRYPRDIPRSSTAAIGT